MLFARILGAIGRVMVSAGVLLLAFVAYQLWGTQLHTNAAQADLRSRFDAQLAAPPTTAPPAPEAEPATAPLDLPVPELGDPVARIEIPDIGVDFIVISGVDPLPLLQDGPGHFPNTPLPGQPGNSVIAGHRTTFAAPFHRLDELAPGAEVRITTLQGEFRYEVLPQTTEEPEAPVTGHYIVGPADVWILDDKGDNRLTLMACHPKYSAAQRIVVEAELANEPAPPSPPPPEPVEVAEPDELLTGNPEAMGPALAWSAAAGLVWFLAWFVGRRWRRWPAYLLGFPVFVVLTYQAFVQISQLLPAAY